MSRASEWASASREHLKAQPKWNYVGQRLMGKDFFFAEVVPVSGSLNIRQNPGAGGPTINIPIGAVHSLIRWLVETYDVQAAKEELRG